LLKIGYVHDTILASFAGCVVTYFSIRIYFRFVHSDFFCLYAENPCLLVGVSLCSSLKTMKCVRCGIAEDTRRMEQRRKRKMILLCASCDARPEKTIQTQFGKCMPWHGLFDLEDNPLKDDGTPYLKGERLCGKRDCVSTDHLVTFSES
jgi:hypothetical protein